jgi:hypothetical protein
MKKNKEGKGSLVQHTHPSTQISLVLHASLLLLDRQSMLKSQAASWIPQPHTVYEQALQKPTIVNKLCHPDFCSHKVQFRVDSTTTTTTTTTTKPFILMQVGVD